MDVVGHHHESVRFDVRSEHCRPLPFPCDDLAKSGKMHDGVDHTSKQARLLGGADGDEVAVVSGVIKPWKANAPAAQNLRLVAGWHRLIENKNSRCQIRTGSSLPIGRALACSMLRSRSPSYGRWFEGELSTLLNRGSFHIAATQTVQRLRRPEADTLS